MMKTRREKKEEEGSFSYKREFAGLRAWSAVFVVIDARNINGGEYL